MFKLLGRPCACLYLERSGRPRSCSVSIALAGSARIGKRRLQMASGLVGSNPSASELPILRGWTCHPLESDSGKLDVVELAATVRELNTRLTLSVRPLFLEDVYRRRVSPLGSCVLTSINDVKFAFTAAHVMRKHGFRNEFNEVPVGLATPAGRIVSFAKSAPIFSAHLANDPDLDIGLVRFAPEIWREHRDCEFLSTSDCERDHQDDRSGNSIYLLIGYPGSRRMTKIERGQIRQRSVCVATLPASQERYTNLNIMAKNYILLEYDETKVTYQGRRRCPPGLAGISGGGVFRVRKGTHEPRLVGIITEFHRTAGLIMATRIDSFFWLSAAYSVLPGLPALLKTKPQDCY